MHLWGNDKVDWEGIHAAAHFIGEYLIKWGRIRVLDTKEKYGTVRVYCSFGWYQLHDLTHPGYHYCRYPKWLWKLDFAVFAPIISRTIGKWIVPYHKYLYRRAYKLALQKWPHLENEILECADWEELLKGLNKNERDSRVFD